MAGRVRRALPRRRHFSEKVIFYMMVGYLLMAVLFGCMYFVNARQSTEAQVVDQIGHSLDRTRLDLEGLIETCENVYVSLLSDGELYDFLIGYDAGETSYPSARRTVNALLQDAIRNIDVLCSVQLMSDDYVFYTSNTTYTSVANVQESMIYQAARRVNSPFWTSLYDFTREYGHTQLEDPEIPVANRNLISYVGPFNAYRLEESTLRMWPSEVEKPVVFINLSEESVREILTNTSSLYDGACFLVDDRGTCIAHTSPEGLYMPMDAAAWERVRGDSDGRGAMTMDYAGVPSLISYTTLSTGWTLVTVLPSGEVYSEIYGVIWRTLVLMLLALMLLGALLALLVSRQLSRPIRQLTQAINIAAKGNFMVNLPRTDDEFDAVNAAFNDMTHRIDQLIHENYEVKLRERENELRALKYQTKPHFLYNALAIIRSQALKDGDAEVAQMVQNLSNVLRYVLRGDQNLTTVRDEVNNVMDYFELMRAGYDGAISLEVDVESAVLNAAICKMTLQPLVENCVQHGLVPQGPGGRVRLAGRLRDGRVSLVVSDNGAGWPEGFAVNDDEHQTESIGLANVRRRMKLTFGDECDFRLFTPDGGGAAVEIVFPYQFGGGGTMGD